MSDKLVKRFHIIYNQEDGSYDLLTEEQVDAKSDDFWDDWQSKAFEVELGRLITACKKHGISTKGFVVPFPSGSGFNNFYYDVILSKD